MELSVVSVVSCLQQQLTITNALLFLAVIVFAAEYVKRRKPKNFPPGPFSWPFVGSLASADFKQPHIGKCKMTEQYGDIFSMHSGSMRCVVLNGLQRVKEAFVHQGDIFEGRTILPLYYEMFKHYGIIHSNGHVWKQQRRFALLTLRNFGMGKRSLEERISEEIQYLTDAMEEEKGQPFQPHFMIKSSVSNVICAINFGERFDYQDPQFQKMLQLLDETLVLELSVSCQLYNAFPQIMKYLPGTHQQVFKIWNTTKDYIKQTIQKHKEHWNPSEPRDFIDCYLTEIEKFKGDASSSFDEENLVLSTYDLFVAGTETTSTTLCWALLYMAKYTEIQEKVQAEIDQVIGHARQPLMENQKSMPYTKAVIHEVQRISNIVPLGVPRLTTSDTMIGGFYLPKGTTVYPNLTSVLFDKNEWETPDKFNPAHFLENGKFKKPEAFVPFSIGNRACPGEQLAKMELFLYLTTLLQKFTLRAPKDVILNVHEYRLGITLTPLPYKICAIARC